MTSCATCGKGSASKTVILPNYRADILGAPFPVYLDSSVKQETCLNCGAILKTTIPDPDGLLRVIVQTRSAHPYKLSGKEIRFLREALHWKAKDLASMLDISPEHLSRVENGVKILRPSSEKFLRIRLLTRAFQMNALDKVDIGEISDLIDMKIEPLHAANKPLEFVFKRSSSGDCLKNNNENGNWLRPKAA